MNGTETHLNGGGENGGLKITTEDAVEDPEILAAIAASKQDLEEEADPAVLAAIEASKQETDVDGDEPVEEPKKESKGPILMFSTLGRNDEENNEDDEYLDGHVEEEPLDGHVEEEPLQDNNGHAEEEAEPGDLDPDDDPDDPPPMEEDEAPKKEKLNHTLRRAYLTKVKPEKRYCSSDDDDDDDYGAKKKKKKAPAKKAAPAKAKTAVVVPSGPSTVFKCPNCSLTFETIGQLNVHKHQTHGEDKPSILDMGEAVIARLQEKSGAPKDKVLKNILADFGDMVEDAAKVENKLGIALVEGIEWGRLRQGTSGKKNWNNYWLQENAKKRKTMMDKWVAEPSSVGDNSASGGEVTVNIIENSGEFLAIKV